MELQSAQNLWLKTLIKLFLYEHYLNHTFLVTAFEIKAFLMNTIDAMQADKLHKHWKFGSHLKLSLTKELMHGEKPSLTVEEIRLDKFFLCKQKFTDQQKFKAFSY